MDPFTRLDQASDPSEITSILSDVLRDTGFSLGWGSFEEIVISFTDGADMDAVDIATRYQVELYVARALIAELEPFKSYRD